MAGLVGQGCGSGLVDDAYHLQAGQFAGIAGGLALGVGEIGRHGDHRLAHGLTQVFFGGALETTQDEGGDLLGRVGLLAHPYLLVVAHLPLDGAHGAFGVEGVLVAGHLPDQQGAVVGEAHHGRQ